MDKLVKFIKNKKNKIIEVLTVLIFTIFFYGISRKFIQPNIFVMGNEGSKIVLMRLNIVFLLLLYLSFKFIFNFIEKLELKDDFYKKWIKNFCIYFFIMLVVLLLIWPGHWVWDEFGTLGAACTLDENTWQSYITIIYMSVCLMLFPSPISIVIIQNIVLSMIISYIYTKLLVNYNNKWCNILLFIFMLFPSIIINNMYPLRITMYSYIMLMLFVKILFDYRNKENMTFKKMFIYICVNILLILWRSEGIIFAIIQPILVVCAYKNINKKILIAIILIIVNLGVYKSYNSYFGQTDYCLTIYVNPLSQMLQKELNGKNIDKDIENINKVLSVDVLKEYPSYTEIEAFWSGKKIVRDDWEDNLEVFKKSYVKIVINNWKEFFKARTKTFLATSCDYKGFSAHIGNRFIDYLVDSNKLKPTVKSFLNNYKYTKPINKEVKVKVESILIGDIRTDTFIRKVLRKSYILIFWDVLPIIIIEIVFSIVSFIRKNYLYTLIFLSLFGSAVIIFLTAPASFFMYYFTTYLCGTVISIIYIAQLINDKTKKISSI